MHRNVGSSSGILRHLLAKNGYSILLKAPMAKVSQPTGYLVDIYGYAFQVYTMYLVKLKSSPLVT